jgi:hypothetical protein
VVLFAVSFYYTSDDVHAYFSTTSTSDGLMASQFFLRGAIGKGEQEIRTGMYQIQHQVHKNKLSM